MLNIVCVCILDRVYAHIYSPLLLMSTLAYIQRDYWFRTQSHPKWKIPCDIQCDQFIKPSMLASAMKWWVQMAFSCKNDEPRHTHSESNQKRKTIRQTAFYRTGHSWKGEEKRTILLTWRKFHSFNALYALAWSHLIFDAKNSAPNSLSQLNFAMWNHLECAIFLWALVLWKFKHSGTRGWRRCKGKSWCGQDTDAHTHTMWAIG